MSAMAAQPIIAVLDTNVVIAGLLWEGPPYSLLIRATERRDLVLVTPHDVPRVVTDDVDDDHVIAAAVAARAQFIVTGDRAHLLPIGTHGEIAIISPRQCLDLLGP